jgi:hypothetical protein
VSCRIISIDEFAKITPVNPPIVKRKINPNDHKEDGLNEICVPW